MQKIRGLFTQDSRRRESKSMAFSRAQKDVSKDNLKGSMRKRNQKAGSASNRARNEEAQRRWKLLRERFQKEREKLYL